jgi:Putative beta-barrel porin 2
MIALPAVILSLAPAAAPGRIVAVRVDTVDSRPAVRVLVAGPLNRVEVRREGDEVQVLLDAQAPAGLPRPPVSAPLRGVEVEKANGGTRLRVGVAPEVPYEVRRDSSVVTVLFGDREGQADTAPSDTADLYRRLFPTAPADNTSVSANAEPDQARAAETDRAREGLLIGSVTLRPTVAASYVDGKSVLGPSPEPVPDHYYQVQPRVSAEAPLLLGELKADYEARLRRGSSFELLDSTTHLLNGRIEMPLGVRIMLRGSEHFARGTLETTEVDPGREFFFGLARFRRNLADVNARIEAGSRTSLVAGASHDVVKLDGPSGFFDHERQGARGGLSFDLTPALRADLLYGYERVPTPARRPEAGLRAQQGSLAISGEILPLLSGEVQVGYRTEDHPRGPEGGGSFQGWTASGTLTRELSRSFTVRLSGSRSTQLSAFESNAFYVANAGEVEVTAPLPYAFSLHGGVGYHENRYRIEALELNRPRRDEIFGWTVGLGRPLSRWAYLRVDYRRERRDSNVPGLSNETDSLVVQVGAGFFGTGSPR